MEIRNILNALDDRDFLWSAVTIHFGRLNKLHYSRPITWNGEKKEFSVDKTPPKSRLILWIITNFITFFACIILPPYILFFKGELLITPKFFLIMMFFPAYHTIPLFYKILVLWGDAAKANNEVIKLNEFLWERLHQFGKAPQTLQRKLLGVVLSIFSASLFTFPFAVPLYGIVANADSLYHILPEPIVDTIGVKLLRGIVLFISVWETSTIIGVVHVSNLVNIYSFVSCLKNLARFSKPTEFQVSRSVPAYSNYSKYKDIQLYLIIATSGKLIHSYYSYLNFVIMSFGLGLFLPCSYIVIKLRTTTPILLYFICLLVALSIPILALGELTLEAAMYTMSLKVIARLNGQLLKSRSKLRRKIVKSLQPTGLYAGGLFRIQGSTTAKYLDTLVNSSITHLLSV